LSNPSAAFQFEPLEADPILDAPPGVRAAQAADVISQARAEATAIREAAQQEGFQAGFEAGLAQAQATMQPVAAALQEAHVALGAERERAAEVCELHAIDLALRLAEKTLGAALQARPEHVVDVVRGGLRRLLERDRVIVLVNPEDMELVRDATADLKAQLGGIGELDVQAERRVSRGGAIVRTETGEVDGRLETQLERAREALLAAMTSDEPVDAGEELL
jgi:flagellar biosynthesis/type III secretory pathway protein FliH